MAMTGTEWIDPIIIHDTDITTNWQDVVGYRTWLKAIINK